MNFKMLLQSYSENGIDFQTANCIGIVVKVYLNIIQQFLKKLEGKLMV